MESDVDDGDNLAGEFCTIDGTGRRVRERTIGEMEQEYLLALSSFYFEGKPQISDEEFELLKEELIWNGSKIPLLDSDEQKFLEASVAFSKEKPIMSDAEYDELKKELKLKNSVVAAEGPRCSLRTQAMYSDATADYARMTLLNIPATLIVLGVLFSLDDLTGFEITELIELPPPYGIVALWALVLPVVFVLATSITNVILPNNLVLKGKCPNCGTENFTYFGDIFTVKGNTGSNVVDCTNCSAGLTFDQEKRILVVSETAEEKAKKLAAAAAKKAAAAAKKKARVDA